MVAALQEAAAAHDAFLTQAAGRAFAAPDPAAQLLQGALTGLLDAVRLYTLRRTQVQTLNTS